MTIDFDANITNTAETAPKFEFMTDQEKLREEYFSAEQQVQFWKFEESKMELNLNAERARRQKMIESQANTKQIIQQKLEECDK